jgi:predicted nucleic acid-binding protein
LGVFVREGRFQCFTLITFARIGQLATLPKLFGNIYASLEVYSEVVIARAGMPGALSISTAEWIHVAPVRDAEALAEMISKTGLGAGETSAVVLAKEIHADLVLMDERKGRRLATQQGLAVVGCVGILEGLYRRGEIKDLRQAYAEMLRQKIRIDLRTLQLSLERFDLAAL